MPDKKTTKDLNTEEAVKFKGKFIAAIGRRKTSVASVRLYKKGNGEIIINGKDIEKAFPGDDAGIIKQPLKMAGAEKESGVSVIVKGGGKKGQAEAIRHGIARALVETDEKLKPTMKVKGLLTRDARRKERKKPGLKKARRAPQWSKR